jgi:hypothetical protein
LANPERTREVETLYEALGTLQAVGDHLGISRERVRQILAIGRQNGTTTVIPRLAQLEQTKRKRESVWEAQSERKNALDPIRGLYELAANLGYVPSTTTLQWGSEPGAQQRGMRGPYYALYQRLYHALSRSGLGVRAFLDEVSEITGLPCERRPHDWSRRCSHPESERYPSGNCRICFARWKIRTEKRVSPAERAALLRGDQYESTPALINVNHPSETP